MRNWNLGTSWSSDLWTTQHFNPIPVVYIRGPHMLWNVGSCLEKWRKYRFSLLWAQYLNHTCLLPPRATSYRTLCHHHFKLCPSFGFIFHPVHFKVISPQAPTQVELRAMVKKPWHWLLVYEEFCITSSRRRCTRSDAVPCICMPLPVTRLLHTQTPRDPWLYMRIMQATEQPLQLNT